MNRLKQGILCLVFLGLVSTPLLPQDQRTLDTKLADLLVRLPAHNQEQTNGQMKFLLELGQDGLSGLLEMIIPPGTGDDTKPRFAVESLSRFLSGSGFEKEKLDWERMILEEIGKRHDPDVKSFLMSQLNYMGGEATLAGLTGYLCDQRLQDPAIRAMRDINPPAAAVVFEHHLGICSGESQVALVNAIKEIGTGEQAPAVARLAGGGLPELQRSVLACLAALGNPASFGVLSDAARKAGYLPEPTNATVSLLSYAESLAEAGQHSLSLKICRTLLKKCNTPGQLHFKSHALLIAAGNETIENAGPMLVEALKSSHKPYRMAAIGYAIQQHLPLDPWLEALRSARSSEVKEEILYLMGMLPDERTSGVVEGYLSDPDAGVRQQAARSLALILKGEAVEELIGYTRAYPALPDTETAREVLLQTVGSDHARLLVDQLNEAPEGARVVFLEVIAARGNSEYFPVLFRQVQLEGETRAVALENLHRVSAYEHLDQLLVLFDGLESPDERLKVERALVASVQRGGEREAATRTVLTFANDRSQVRKFIGLLGNIGGNAAMDAVYKAYQTGDEATKQEAFHALTKSGDLAAVPALLDICAGNQSTSDKETAFGSYVRIVRRSGQPDDQKLLLLRKIEPFAPDLEATRMLIRAMGNLKTFLSFVSVNKYMENKALQGDAANAVIAIALPSDGLDNGLSGEMVREALVKAREVIAGPESEYTRIDIGNYLEQMSADPGFVPIFNGRDLSGWQGLAADPAEKKKLSAEALQKLQAEADAKVPENWGVKENCIVFNGRGANLCTIREYGSFELIVDWRITKKGDSGIYLRGTPQVQIWDTSRVEAGAQVGSGGLYNNQDHESDPLVVADNPVGDWNTFHITMTGERVSVTLNGQLVVDDVIMENYWDRSMPVFPTGPIELQAHGTDLAFRDLYIKELEPPLHEISEAEIAEGFVALFNGRDLDGWTGIDHGYEVENGTIAVRPEKGGGNLYTEKEYSDFVFRFEFKLTPGANNGLGIRTPLEGNAAYVGYELQILDNTASVYASLEPYQYHGSVYGIIPARRGFLKPVGEWNSQEVAVDGDEIRITLNGTTILEGNLKDAAKGGTADGKDHPGLLRTGGHIGFLGHGSLVWFRNIRIKEL